MSSPTTDLIRDSSSSDSSESESPPAKRSLTIEPSSIEPITRQQHYLNSKTKKCNFYHQWTIENFSYYFIRENSANQYPCLYSSTFSSPSNDKLQFRLLLYPNGCNEKSKNNVSLFVKLENCDRNEIVLRYLIWAIDSDGNFQHSFDATNKFYHKKTWGRHKVWNIKNILDSSSKLTPGDVLTIACEFIHYEETVDGNDDEDDSISVALTELENDCWQLSKSDELSDVVLVFGDGDHAKEFAVHSAILSARSCVFAAMFEHDMKEKNKRRVDITDVDAEVGQQLVEYLYSGFPFPFPKYASKLLPIADKYQLHSLKSMCQGALCFQINPESVGNLLLLADMHQADMLKSKCIDYIHCHASCVVDGIQDMSDIMKSRPELYYELFTQNPQDSCNNWFPPTLTCCIHRLSWSYTSSSVSKCSKRWTIEKFHRIHLLSDNYLDKHPNDFMETSSFPQSSDKSDNNNTDNSPVQFSVKLYPHGENDDCTEHLSLQLQLKCDDKMKVAVKVKASIMVRQNSAKAYTLEIGKELSNGESIGWPKFITREQLMENEDLLLNGNDKLELLLEVFYISNIDKPVTKSGVNTFADEHKFSFSRDLSQFYSNQKLTDIVFVVGNKPFPAHKSIVSARSDVFARMFANTSRVQIKDVDDVEAFEHLLALVYGQTESLSQWAHKMLPLVDKFELDSLGQVCQIALCEQLDDPKVVDFLLLADKHKATMLKAKAFEYIRRKHSVLTQNDSLKVIQQQSPKLFHELLCYKLDNWKTLLDK